MRLSGCLSGLPISDRLNLQDFGAALGLPVTSDDGHPGCSPPAEPAAPIGLCAAAEAPGKPTGLPEQVPPPCLLRSISGEQPTTAIAAAGGQGCTDGGSRPTTKPCSDVVSVAAERIEAIKSAMDAEVDDFLDGL
eukprot:EG_transcript_36601